MSADAGTEAPSARAWLLPLRGGVRAAAAEHELLEVLPRPDLEAGAAADAPSLSWRGRRLALLDPAAPFHRETAVPWAVVARVPEAGGGVGVDYGALALAAPPRALTVRDALACEPPDATLLDHLVWSYFALSAFRHDGEAVPILDLPLLFSAAGRARLARYATAGWTRDLTEEHA